MTRLYIHPDDIIKPIVWKSVDGTNWCVAWMINGVVETIAARFASWCEAMDFALSDGTS